MMRSALLIATLLLSACTTTHELPIVKTFNARTVEVTWIRSSAPCGGAQGCAKFGQGDRNACTVWSPEPTDWGDEGALQILGHEMIHCFYGAGHDG